jgi:predicted RNA-binding Zn ribbon-like protein
MTDAQLNATSISQRLSLENALNEISVEFVAGQLCLDFANAADWHASAQPIELVPTYTHLVAWARLRDVLDADTAAHLIALAAERPAEADAVHRRAIALREAIYRLFSDRQHGKPVHPATLATINAELQCAFDHLRVSEPPFAWEWTDTNAALDQFLWPVARSVAELLTSPDVERVRECAGDPCGWLFLDTSRNRSRRWCSMESCGNRAKARRHYERSRSARTTR